MNVETASVPNPVIPEDLAPFTKEEETLLGSLEDVIKEHVEGFENVAGALWEIRERKLWRKEFKSFAEYCECRWEFKAQWAYKLLAGEGVVRLLEGKVASRRKILTVDEVALVKNSSANSKAELAKVPEAKLVNAVKTAAKRSDKGRITIPVAKEVVSEFTDKPKDPPTPTDRPAIKPSLLISDENHISIIVFDNVANRMMRDGDLDRIVGANIRAKLITEVKSMRSKGIL